MKFEKNNIINIKRAGAVLLTLALIIVGLKCSNKILRNNSSYFKYKAFLENKTDYDVLFYGSSHVTNAIFPMQLWHDYGITSYNLAQHDCGVAVNYYLLELTLKKKTPKVIVLDVLKPYENENITTKTDNLHKAFDAFPLGFTKIKLMLQLSKHREDDSLGELLNPFSLYHSRWSEDDIKFETLFDKSKNVEMGAESRINVAVPNKFEIVPKNIHFDENSMPYLERFIKLCKKKNIPLVLTFLPFPATEKELKWANTCEIIAEKYNVPFINYFDLNLVDLTIDCYDKHSHLNPSGARKVTNFIGSYLQKEYHLIDHRSDDKYSKDWNLWFEEYKNYQIRAIQQQYIFKNLLMLLNNSNFISKVSFSNRYNPDSIEQTLLSQISSNCTVQTVPFKNNENKDAIVEVFDSVSKKRVHNVSFLKDSSGVLKKQNPKSNTPQKDNYANNTKEQSSNIESAIAKYKNTARFDIKNAGAKANAIKIVSNSSKASFRTPNWFVTDTGIGQLIESNERRIDFSFECIGDGGLSIVLRGHDFRDSNGKRVPIKVKVTNLTINGEQILKEPKIVWHDDHYKWGKIVKNGEIITVHAEWVPAEN